VLEQTRLGELMSVDHWMTSSHPADRRFLIAHESDALRMAFDEFLAGYVGSIEHRERMLRNG
jgi:hypothetical protein